MEQNNILESDRLLEKTIAQCFEYRVSLPPALPLHPVNPDNACTIRITAAAGTYLAGAS